MNKFDIISIGGAVKDHTLFTQSGKIFSTPNNLTSQKMIAFEYGAKVKVGDAHLNLGGGAANSAIALARLGLKAGIICRIGQDEVGSEIISKLKKEKVSLNYVQRDEDNFTGFSFIVIADKKDRDRTIFTYKGAGDQLSVQAGQLKKAKPSWIYLTSLSGTKWNKNLKEIFEVSKSKNIKIYWNPGSKQLQAGKKALSGYLKQTEILALNKDEAIELVLSGVKIGRKNPKHFNRPVYLLNILHEWGPKIIMITDGQKGAYVYDGQKIYHSKIKRSKAIDRTGVGDCHGSTFLAGYIKEKNIDRALEWANVNTASVVAKIGAQNGLLTKNQLIKKLTK